MEKVMLPDQETAETVLGTMKDIITKYKDVTVGDYYNLVGLPSTYLHNKSGWSDLSDVTVQPDGPGRWYIDLPEPTKFPQHAIQNHVVPAYDRVVNNTLDIAAGPQLGLASTEDLFQELICRLAITPLNTPTDVGHYKSVKRGLVLSEMLGSLEVEEREYRTVRLR